MKNARGLRADKQERVVLAITAAISVVLSTGTIGALIYLLIAVGSLISSPIAYAQAGSSPAAVRLEAGIEKENVDGDLKGAMSIYAKIASDASAQRDVRAKALLRLAGCDEKLGKQAKQVYEQLVREYGDQPAAAQARTRLAAIKQQEHPSPPATMTARRIEWAKLGRVSPHNTDGERATFLGSEGSVFYGDIAGHARNLVFALKNDSHLLGYWTARDFSRVVFALRATTGDRPVILAEVKTDGAGYRELIRDGQGGVFGSAEYYVNTGVEINWSWDNHYLAVTTRYPGEGGRLLVIDIGSGSYRELVRSDSDYLRSVRFSPDGRFIAYEATPAKSSSGTNRVYVVPARGGEPHLAKVAPRSKWFYVLKDWTADGRYLIVNEAQQGKPALYLLPMKDGAPAGPSEFVRFGDFDDAHTTPSGALVYQDHATTPTDVAAFLASIDSNGHIGNWRGLDLRGGRDLAADPFPSFSPGGNQIAYVAAAADPEQTDLIVLDLSTGQQRVLYHSSDGYLTCQYSNKELKAFCALSRDGSKKTDLFSVDDKTGAVEKIASLQGSRYMLHYPGDGKTIYFVGYGDGKEFEATRWDLGTKQETVVVPKVEDGGIPSADGRWLLRTVPGDSLSVRPMSGGDWRTLASGVKGLDSGNDTTHDGSWVFYWANDSTGKTALFRVPTTGGAPERVGDLPNASFRYLFTLSADDRQILATNWGPQKYDLWVLENFEPSLTK